MHPCTPFLHHVVRPSPTCPCRRSRPPNSPYNPPLRPAFPSPQVFELNPLKAWGAVVTSLVSMSASLYLISISPWYLLPFAWFIAGTAFTGVGA